LKSGKHKKAYQPWKAIQLVLHFLHFSTNRANEGATLATKDQRIQAIDGILREAKVRNILFSQKSKDFLS
jgi:hypothetical protein